jgi:hypothetical protein
MLCTLLQALATLLSLIQTTTATPVRARIARGANPAVADNITDLDLDDVTPSQLALSREPVLSSAEPKDQSWLTPLTWLRANSASPRL